MPFRTIRDGRSDSQREQRKQAFAQRKLEMIKRIEALIAELSKEDYALAVGGKGS